MESSTNDNQNRHKVLLNTSGEVLLSQFYWLLTDIADKTADLIIQNHNYDIPVTTLDDIIGRVNQFNAKISGQKTTDNFSELILFVRDLSKYVSKVRDIMSDASVLDYDQLHMLYTCLIPSKFSRGYDVSKIDARGLEFANVLMHDIIIPDYAIKNNSTNADRRANNFL